MEFREVAPAGGAKHQEGVGRRRVQRLVDVAVGAADGRVEGVVRVPPTRRRARRRRVAHGAQLLAHALAHELRLLGAQVARLDKLAEALLHVPQREEVEALAQRRRERRAARVEAVDGDAKVAHEHVEVVGRARVPRGGGAEALVVSCCSRRCTYSSCDAAAPCTRPD